MSITIGNIYAGKAVPVVVGGADNGLSVVGTDVELGGPLIKNTSINLSGFNLQFIDDLAFFTMATDFIQLEVNDPASPNTAVQLALLPSQVFFQYTNPSGLTSAVRIFSTGLDVYDTLHLIGLVNNADYSANIIANLNALTTTKAVNLLIAAAASAGFAGYARLTGAAFTGPISATNLSGTNTGDQNLAPYALIAGQIFTGNISATNLSGTNTGDQNLAPYALIAGQVFTGAISATNLSGTNTGDQNLAPYALIANTPQIVASQKLNNAVATATIISYVTPAANAAYRLSVYMSTIAFTVGTIVISYSYTNFNGSAENVTLITGTSLADGFPSVRLLNVKASTTVTVTVTITGTSTSNVGACLEFMF